MPSFGGRSGQTARVTVDVIGAARAGQLEGRRLAGGISHDVFVTGDAPVAVVKVYRSWGRDEPAREWEALGALRGTGLAAAPVSFDAGDPPVVVMSFVAGAALASVGELTSPRLSALGAVHRRVHAAVAPSGRLALNHPAVILPKVRAMFDEWEDGPAAAKAWLASSSPDRLVSEAADVFCRGDTNLSNTLWSGDAVSGLVDFEDSGVGDPAVEIGDMAEHLSTRGAPDVVWDELADATGLTSPAARSRITDARRLMACWWLVILERRRRRGDPPVQLGVDEQSERVRALLG